MPARSGIAETGGADHTGPVHLPDEHFAAAVLQPDVGMAVAFVVAGTHHVPRRTRTCQTGSGVPLLAVPPMFFSFIFQSCTPPLLFSHRMSEKPSPLKSPVPTTCQLGPGLPRTAPPIMLVPFISQIATEPSSFCHRM